MRLFLFILAILIVLAALSAAIALTILPAPYEPLPPDIELKCKIQSRGTNGIHYAIAQDGKVYEIDICEWVFLNIPICD